MYTHLLPRKSLAQWTYWLPKCKSLDTASNLSSHICSRRPTYKRVHSCERLVTPDLLRCFCMGCRLYNPKHQVPARRHKSS